ncbi:MAG: mersacidin/lichenicidin family type 2 lantibiotic [Terriglobia bacterium]
MDGLFRDEVVQAQRPQALGSVYLATPLSSAWWTLTAVALAASILLFLTFGRKTIRAMQNKNFRAQLSPREQRALGTGPSGTVGLDDRLLEAIGGGTQSNNGCGSDGAKGGGSCTTTCQV